MRKTIKSTLAGLVVLTGLSVATTVDAAAKYIAYDSPTANSVAKTKAAIKNYPIKYKISNNDSVVNIAKAAGVSVKDFMKANQITNYKKVEVGSFVLATDSSIYSQLKKPYAYTEFISVDFKTIKKVNKSLKLGETKVKVKGVKGLNKVVDSYKYVKGIKTLTSKTTVIKKPVNKIIEFGPSETEGYQKISKIISVPFNKLIIGDLNLPDGESYIKQKGQMGKNKKTYTALVLAKNIEVNAENIKIENISKPVDEIKVVGLKIPTFSDDVLKDEYGYNKKFRDIRYESDTLSTNMGYRPHQTTWLGYKVTKVNDQLRTTLPEIKKETAEARYAKANDNKYQNTISILENGYDNEIGMRANFNTQRMFNNNELFDEQLLQKEFFKLVNEERQRLNIAPLQINPELKEGNETRANEMAVLGSLRVNNIPHRRPDGEMYYTAFNYLGDNRARGEISAMNYYDGNLYQLMSEKYLAEQAFSQWKNSPGHYAAMLGTQYHKAYFSIKMYESFDVNKDENMKNYQVMIANTVFQF